MSVDFTTFVATDDKGFLDRTKPIVPMNDYRSSENLQAMCEQFVHDVEELFDNFNIISAQLGLGVRACCKSLRRRVLEGEEDEVVETYFDDHGYGGRLYVTQMRTALDALTEMLTDPTKSGVILGALQSGKTGTGLALQFLGPVFYLMTGVKLYVLYLVTSAISHNAQTTHEFVRFMQFYGHVRFYYDRKSCSLLEYAEGATFNMVPNPKLPTDPHIDSRFLRNPSLKTYRNSILSDGIPQYRAIRPDDYIKRRVHGKAVGELKQFVASLCDNGYVPIFILDESHYGASDRIKYDVDTGKTTTVPCVLSQLITGFEEVIGEDARLICLSATPFDTINLENLWQVKQYLPDNYVGFNMFMGQKIDGSANVNPPNVVSFEDFANRLGHQWIGEWVNMSLYRALVDIDKNQNKTNEDKGVAFVKWARKVGYYLYDPNADAYQQAKNYCTKLEREMRNLIYSIAKINDGISKSGKTMGACLRLAPDNAVLNHMIKKMKLDNTRVEVIEYLGDQSHLSNEDGLSVKSLLSLRKTPNIPAIMFVSARARMGDSFPLEFETFIDMTARASNLNALLQGLLGRACGVGKNTTVVMSPTNVSIVEQYIADGGRLRRKASPHVTHGGESTTITSTTMLKLDDNHPDPYIKKFLALINSDVVDEYLVQGVAALKRKKEGGASFFALAKQCGVGDLFDYIEQNAAILFPNLVGELKIARQNSVVISKKGVPLPYVCDNPVTQTYLFTFRSGEKIGGVGSRGKGKRDSQTDRARAAARLEFQINLEKFDPITGAPMDHKATKDQPGNRRAFMITVPLEREASFANGAAIDECFPHGELHALRNRMSDEEAIREAYYREGVDE